MPLSINPLAKLVASVSESVSAATNAAGAAKVPGIGDALSKASLDGKISQLSGAVGSGLNGATANIKDLAANATTALGGIGGAVQSKVGGVLGGASNAISSLQSVAGTTSNITANFAGALGKLGAGNIAGGLQNLAATISGAAGALNNILSIFKGAAIPPGGELFVKQGSAIRLAPGAANDWRVRITCDWTQFNSPIFKPLENTGGVVWPYLPNITISTKANYTAPDSVHSIYPFQAYKNSMVEDITISGEFTCETELEAAYWISATTFFKTATKMFFGSGDNAGSPPIICNLTGYGSSIFDKVPVIIKSFSVDLKDDVNYIRCNAFGTNTWVPAVSSINVTVAPIYNRARLRQFNLKDYASGKMTAKDGVGYL